MEVKVYDMNAQEKGKIEIPDVLIEEEVNKYFLHEVVKYYLSNERVGTASTKTRAEVSGGGRKPWRQKHTGRSRQGSIRSPLWKGGGVVFGPKPRDYSLDIPKKKLKLALKQALTQRLKENAVYIFEVFSFSQPKTKNFVSLINNLSLANKKILVVLSEVNDATLKSMRNYPYVEYVSAQNVNAYDILNSEVILMDKNALDVIAKRLEEK
ncbi:MAG: 50S ribosomal protein L4 [Elusimicrobiales bacterium]|nr:50S ribosomal protein L4 [Elusimicrobiales bacterium]